MPDEVPEGLLLVGGRQLPPLRPEWRETEVAAVPGGRSRRTRAPRPGTQNRVHKRDGEVGGKELVREPELPDRQGAPDRVGELADLDL